MYLKDFKHHLILVFFLSVGTADEILILLGKDHSTISIIYTVMIIYFIINYEKYTEGKYLWPGAFPIIGLFAVMELVSYLLNFYSSSFEKVDSIVSILVWLKCVNYLDNYDENDENNEVEEDESVGEV